MQSKHVDDDYIDLLSVFRIVWQGKWIIVSMAVAGFLVSILYLAMLPSKYTLRVPYETHLYSIEALNLCANNISCLQSETKAILLAHNKSGWSIGKDPAFTKTISDVSSSNSNIAELEQIKAMAKQIIKKSVEREIDVLQKQMPQALDATETFTKHMLVATRVQAALAEEEAQVITLGQPVVRSVNPSAWVIVMAFSLVGLIGGLVIVFLVHFVRSVALRLESD